jgi:hypothetical protein
MPRTTRARRFGTSITSGHGTDRPEPGVRGRFAADQSDDVAEHDADAPEAGAREADGYEADAKQADADGADARHVAADGGKAHVAGTRKTGAPDVGAQDEGAKGAVSEPMGTGGGPGAAVVGGREHDPSAASARPDEQPHGPVARVIGLIYKLANSTLATPRIALAISLTGIALVMLVGIFSPNYNTLAKVPVTYHTYVAIVLPLSGKLGHLPDWASISLTFTSITLQSVGLAGLLWANSRGWRPNPRHLFLAAALIVTALVFITPVGSSDTTSYAAYGRMANLGIDPYNNGPGSALGPSDIYAKTVGPMWWNTPSVYGPIATWIQQFAALFGGKDNPAAAVSMLMILNGLVFLGVGYFLLKTADDPVRACLMWVANPVLIQQLVAGGHLDTYVAAATVVGVQIARSRSSNWRYLWTGVAIGVGCCFKIDAALAGVAVGWVLLTRREWANLGRLAVGGLGTVGFFYSFYGLHALKQVLQASSLVATPSPWRAFQLAFEWAFGLVGSKSTGQALSSDIISVTWPILMVLVAYAIYRKFGSDQPAVVTVPFALCFAWIVVAPWALPWYTAVAWVVLALVPRNPMTRWLTLVTVYLALMHCSGGGPATWANN